MNRESVFIFGIIAVILLIVLLVISFKSKKVLFYILSIFSFLLCLGIGMFYYSLPLSSEALNVECENNGLTVKWSGDLFAKHGTYNILIAEGKGHSIQLENVDLENIKKKELFSEAAKNDYQNLYLSYFEKSDFYDQEKGYEYFIIPSNYEGTIEMSNNNTNLYYLYLYPEMMGPTRPYWIKKLQ